MLRHPWIPLLSLLPLSACATTHTLLVAPLDAGHERVYPDSLATVVEETNGTLQQVGLVVDRTVRPDSQTYMIIAQNGVSWLSYGELVRVLARPLPSGETAVRVYTVPRFATNVAYTKWEEEVFTQLGRGLARRIRSDTSGRPWRWAPAVEIVRSLAPHASVRIAAGSRRTGSATNDGDSVLVLDGRQRVPVAAMDSLWLKKSYAKAGAILGSLAGIGAGVLIVRANAHPCVGSYGECFSSIYATAIVSAVGGMAVGALIGSVFPKWKFRYP